MTLTRGFCRVPSVLPAGRGRTVAGLGNIAIFRCLRCRLHFVSQGASLVHLDASLDTVSSLLIRLGFCFEQLSYRRRRTEHCLLFRRFSSRKECVEDIRSCHFVCHGEFSVMGGEEGARQSGRVRCFREADHLPIEERQEQTANEEKGRSGSQRKNKDCAMKAGGASALSSQNVMERGMPSSITSYFSRANIFLLLLVPNERSPLKECSFSLLPCLSVMANGTNSHTPRLMVFTACRDSLEILVSLTLSSFWHCLCACSEISTAEEGRSLHYAL